MCLFYQQGYFRQELNIDGWQQERYPRLDPHSMALHRDDRALVPVDRAGTPMVASLSRSLSDRVLLYVPLLPAGLLPPGAQHRRVAAGALPPPRPPLHGPPSGRPRPGAGRSGRHADGGELVAVLKRPGAALCASSTSRVTSARSSTSTGGSRSVPPASTPTPWPSIGTTAPWCRSIGPARRWWRACRGP